MWFQALQALLVLGSRSGACPILRISELSVRIVNCVWTYKKIQLKSKPQHNGIWSAAVWPLGTLCYRPAVFFRHSLIALSLPEEKIRREFQECYFFNFIFCWLSDLGKSEIAWLEISQVAECLYSRIHEPICLAMSKCWQTGRPSAGSRQSYKLFCNGFGLPFLHLIGTGDH
jgi:hypothetical protein